MKKLLVICGPTATGKTALALQLAKEFNGELVSCDSRQVYKGMDIGTGKEITSEVRIPSFAKASGGKQDSDSREIFYKNQRYSIAPYSFDGVPLWMYDVVSPDCEFSVSHYVSLATRVVEEIHKRGKLPILVGGTGFYIQAFLDGIDTIDIPRNDLLRKKLEIKSVEELQKDLLILSPSVFEQMNNSDRNNPRRLVRKIEIFHASSLPAKTLMSGSISSFSSYIIGLQTDMSLLKERIQLRVENRVHNGIIKEIQALLDAGYHWDFPSMNTLGYKEWKIFFDHPTEENKQRAIQAWIHDEILYSKKQMTWFKKQKGIHWISLEEDFYSFVRDRVRLWYTFKGALYETYD